MSGFDSAAEAIQAHHNRIQAIKEITRAVVAAIVTAATSAMPPLAPEVLTAGPGIAAMEASAQAAKNFSRMSNVLNAAGGAYIGASGVVGVSLGPAFVDAQPDDIVEGIED